jgi:hypothetical protein
MTEYGAWKTLAAPGGVPATVLAIDFDATGRQEARFSDLVANMTTADYEIRESVPPAAATTAADYVEYWGRPLEGERTQVHALLGYCAGAVYAAALADRISAWQDREPKLLLFDPEVSVPQTLVWQFYKVVGIMSTLLSEREVGAARERARLAFERAEPLGVLRDVLVGLVREIGEPAFTRAGLDAARRAELLGVFDDFMRFLALAGELSPLARWRSAVVFSSSSPMSGLRGMRCAGRDVAVGREIEVDTDHAGLLADAMVAKTVSVLLDEQDDTDGEENA